MPAVIFVIFLFGEHIIHDSDREQIKLREGQPDLHTPEKEEGRCHRAVSFSMFFLDSACVSTLSPHRALIIYGLIEIGKIIDTEGLPKIYSLCD